MGKPRGKASRESHRPLDPREGKGHTAATARGESAPACLLWPADAKNCLIGKDSDAGRDWRQEEKGTAEDEMAGWHH